MGREFIDHVMLPGVCLGTSYLQTPRTRREMQKNVQNIAYQPRSLSLLASAFPCDWVNIGEKRCGRCVAGCVHLKIGVARSTGAYSGQGMKNEVLIGGCGRSGRYQRERLGSANIQS